MVTSLLTLIKLKEPSKKEPKNGWRTKIFLITKKGENMTKNTQKSPKQE